MFSGEVWLRRIPMTREYNDARDPGRCVVYSWHEREQYEDLYLDSGSDLVEEVTSSLERCAELTGRRVTGPVEYEYVWDVSVLDRNTQRQVSRMRRRTEYRPWWWRRMVLVRAWQSTLPAGSVGAATPGEERTRGMRVKMTGRAAVGWISLAMLAAFVSLLGAFDLGFGVVLGAILLALAYPLVIRRFLYRRAQVPQRVKARYRLAAVTFVLGTIGAASAWMITYGQQGVGSIDSQDSETGSHGSSYLQCYVQQPDATINPLRSGGACPHPDGTRMTMVYMPGDPDGTWRPILGTKDSLAPLAAAWAVCNLAGLSLLTTAVITPREPSAR